MSFACLYSQSNNAASRGMCLQSSRNDKIMPKASSRIMMGTIFSGMYLTLTSAPGLTNS
jgi:hypothetical protein